MTQLWLIPVDEESYQATLAQPIDMSDAPNTPADFPEESRVWGVRTDPNQGSWERNKRNLERMNVGDPLLVYRNSQSKYTTKASVGPFWHTTYIRDKYWDGGPAIDVFAVEDYRKIDLSRDTVNRSLDYAIDFAPQGLWRVADDRPTRQLIDLMGQWFRRKTSLRSGLSSPRPVGPCGPNIFLDGIQ